MPVPNPIRLFHITAIANLQKICAAGALISKNRGAAVGINYQNIAHQGAQGARAVKELPNPPGGVVHDYVPFYFAPRSPMLSAIHNGRVANCQWKQADIVHFETTVPKVVADNKPFVFFDRNATLRLSNPYTDLTQLKDVVAWDLITEDPKLDGYCQYFMDNPRVLRYVDRRERRQAEFLVKDMVPLDRFTRVGVISERQAAEVSEIFEKSGISLPVVVMRAWYFLGQ